MRPVVIAVIALWAVFFAYWLASAFTANETRTEWNPRGAPLRIAVGFLTAFLFWVVRKAGVRLNSLSVHQAPLIALGFVLLLAGQAFAIWARVHLGKNWGMPATQRVNPELITSGPYTYVRHPIYSGILLAGVGTSVAINIIGLMAVVTVGAYFTYSARTEEGNLTATFPDTYPAYKARSKMLIPFLL